MITEHTTPFDAAILYAARGWPVFPCVGKQPHGGHAPRGLHSATTDLATIEQWWDYGKASWNVAIPTGRGVDAVTGDPWETFDVLDIDDELAYREWARDRPDPPDLDVPYATKTGSGGIHVMFRTADTRNRTGFIPGCDWRGTGGYIIAPPSVTTGQYKWWALWPSAPLPDRPTYLNPTTVDMPEGFDATSANLIEQLGDASGARAGWQIGQWILTQSEIMTGLGAIEASDRAIQAAWTAELIDLPTRTTHRNDALYNAVMSATRFAGVDATPIVEALTTISSITVHADHPEWGPLDQSTIAKTVGSAIFRRFCHTACAETTDA